MIETNCYSLVDLFSFWIAMALVNSFLFDLKSELSNVVFREVGTGKISVNDVDVTKATP